MFVLFLFAHLHQPTMEGVVIAAADQVAKDKLESK